MLTTLGVSERNTDDLLNNLNKTAQAFANAVTFAGMLQKLGLKSDDMANILRRIGIDDISITKSIQHARRGAHKERLRARGRG